jgi:hypothetical protein
MATFYKSSTAKNNRPMPVAGGSETISHKVVFNVTEELRAAGKTAFAANDIVELCPLPAGHVPVDAIIAADILGSSTNDLTYDIGLMSGTPGHADLTRTVGTELFSGAVVGNDSASMARMTGYAGLLVTGVDYDRSIGLKVSQAATTAPTLTANGTNPVGLWQPSTAYAVGDWIWLPNGLRAKVTTAGTSGLLFPGGLTTGINAGTVTDGGVTWTLVDLFFSLTLFYRAAYNQR